MKAKPIIFSGPMNVALRQGRKTQTRRAMNPQPDADTEYINEPGGGMACYGYYWKGMDISDAWKFCPFGQPGDLLWVRETHGFWPAAGSDKREDSVIYRADDDDWECRMFDWRSPIYMPRWASRITLEITGVLPIPLQEMSSGDAIAEGILPFANSMTIDCDTPDPRGRFARLWDSINAKRGYTWESNPFVWRLKFKAHNCNVDDFLFSECEK